MQQYDPQEVRLTIFRAAGGSFPVTGFNEETFVESFRNDETEITPLVGSTGQGIEVVNRDFSGGLNVTLIQDHPDQIIFQELLTTKERFRFQLVSTNFTKESVKSDRAFIQQRPRVVFSKNSESRVWMIGAIVIEEFTSQNV